MPSTRDPFHVGGPTIYAGRKGSWTHPTRLELSILASSLYLLFVNGRDDAFGSSPRRVPNVTEWLFKPWMCGRLKSLKRKAWPIRGGMIWFRVEWLVLEWNGRPGSMAEQLKKKEKKLLPIGRRRLASIRPCPASHVIMSESRSRDGMTYFSFTLLYILCLCLPLFLSFPLFLFF